MNHEKHTRSFIFGRTISWISDSIPWPPAKRAAAVAFMSGGAQTVGIWSKYMYPVSASPGYRRADAIDCAAAVVVILAATVLGTLLVTLNRRQDEAIEVDDAGAAVDTIRLGVHTEGARKVVLI